MCIAGIWRKNKAVACKARRKVSVLYEKIAEIFDCTKEEIEPYVHLPIMALNNYMIFNECALFLPQIEAAKKGLMMLSSKRRKESKS